jgi:hypothetical protein
VTVWAPAVQQAEAWTSEAPALRVFDPSVFDHAPIFDTGSTAGIWGASLQQQEAWTKE